MQGDRDIRNQSTHRGVSGRDIYMNALSSTFLMSIVIVMSRDAHKSNLRLIPTLSAGKRANNLHMILKLLSYALLNLCYKWCPAALESTLPSNQNVDDYNRAQVYKLLWTPGIDSMHGIDSLAPFAFLRRHGASNISAVSIAQFTVWERFL
jgi:hypothetical protein